MTNKRKRDMYYVQLKKFEKKKKNDNDKTVNKKYILDRVYICM